jgi:hypothetical protein
MNADLALSPHFGKFFLPYSELITDINNGFDKLAIEQGVDIDTSRLLSERDLLLCIGTEGDSWYVKPATEFCLSANTKKKGYPIGHVNKNIPGNVE